MVPLSGSSIPIKIEGSDTVDLLKHKVLDREGIQPEKQSLVYIGQTLQSRLSLDDYNIRSDPAIYMVLRLHGGGSRTGHDANVDRFRPARTPKGAEADTLNFDTYFFGGPLK
ncbi:hypothetical protein CPC16_012117 [Podila verticillata]|nr:hypothetical protein CPC16_012117 [Podila verticillata]